MFSSLPRGPFQVIYADPPWSYGNKQFNPKTGRATSTADDHYGTITLADLKVLPVPDVVGDDALLFMWATSPHLDQAIELGRAWGFVYKTVAFVWEKVRKNPGAYTMSSVELCLVFKRGRIPTPRGARNVEQFLLKKRTRHSEKPDEIRRRIELMFPSQRKLELFARSRSKGWAAWGDEVD